MALVKDISSNIIACANSVGLKGKACASSVTLGSYTNHKLHLITNSSIRGTFDTSGNFGIGTDSPGARLDVRGSVIFNEAGGDNDVRMEGDTEANLFFLDASTDRVGIGTATPGALFHVEGTSCVTSDVVVGGDLTVAGDDILMGTSTAGYMLVANGTSFKPTAISGDVNIDQTGATTIQAGSVENSMLANSSVSYGGVSVSLGSSDATPAFDLADATNYPTSRLVGTITNAQLAGSIANAKLSNSSVNFGGITVALGASDTTPAFDLSDATDYPTSSLVGTITNAQLAGSIANDKLANSSISYGGVSVSLGGSDGTPAFDLSDATAYPGDTSLVCVGTIAGGTWQGTAIDTDYIGSTLCNKTLCAPVLNGTISGTSFLDEDDFSSDSATSVASQQSIKAYVDAVASGLDLKCSSHVATTANLSASYNNGTAGVGATLTNSGTQEALSIDGDTLVASERVLVKNQTAACHNGIYTVTTVGNGSTNWVLTRATDYDTSTEITSGSFTFVETGTINGDHAFVMTTDGTITVGTTAINWTQFSGAGQITAGAGLTKSGSTINVGAGSNITVNADDVALSTTITGLTALTATTLTGTLATAAQANITSVGTLTSLCVSGDATVGGDLTIAGDDLTMGTNTSGYLLIADGTNYNPTAVSGDVTIDGSGVTTIGATKVTNAMLAGSIANSKLSNSTVSYGGVSLSLGGSDATPAFDLADATNYPTSSLVGTITNAQLAGSIANSKLSNSTITLSDGSNTTAISLGGTMTFAGTSNEVEVAESSGTLTIGLPATVSGLTHVSATCLTGTLQTAAQTNVTSLGTLTALTVDNVTIDGATIGHTSDTDLITLADGSVTIAGDLTISGDDLTMGTNTSGYILVADGTNYNPVAVSGDVAIDNAGAVTIQALAVENSMLAGSIANAKLSNSSVSYGGVSLSLGGSDATPAFDLADATNYPTSSLVGTITNAQLAGSIANDKLSNSTITLSDGSNTTAIALGGTMTFSGTSNEVEVSESSGTLTIGLPSTVCGLTTVSATNLAGTLSTAAQANVTSVGTLTSLTVSGDVTIDTTTLAVNSTTNRVGIGTATPSHLLDVEGVVNVVTCVITPVYCVSGEYALPASDGTTGQVLCTDGSGGLSFATNIPASPGGSDTYVQFNEGGSSFGGSANFTWDDTTVKASNFCTAGTATLATVDINAGAIDGTTIGASSASTIAGTTLTATGNVSFDGGTFVFNESGADKDFRIEGDDEANLFITDASTDRIGVGTATPSHLLDVEGVAHAATCFVSPDVCATTKVVAAALCVGGAFALPTSDGSAGQIICTDGSGALAFATDSTNNPGGNNTNVQFNNSGSFAGSDNLAWDGSTLTVATHVSTTCLTGTLQTAAQANVTSLGTLSALTVSGDVTIDTTTLKVDSSNNRVGIGTASPSHLLDVEGVAHFATCIVTPVVCATGDAVVGGDLTIGGDDLTMGTNTSGYILVADGTNYNPVAVSGDVTISAAGAVTIAADAVENSMLACCTVSYGGVSLALGGSDATPAFDLADATNYPTSSLVGTITNAQLAGSIANSKLANSTITISDGSNTTAISLGGTATFSGTSNEVEVAESSGTVTIGLPSTVCGLTTVSATNLTGTLSTAAQGNVTSLGNLTSLCVSGDTVVGGDLTIAGDDLTMGTNTSGYILVADGTNYNPVAVSGDVTISSAGAITIAAGAVENSMLANCTVSYGGIQLVLGGTDATPAFDLTDATNYPTSSLVGTITNAQLAGSIANDKLSNSSVSFGGVSVALGAADATPAFDLSDATSYPTSSLVGTITNAQLAGSIANSKLANDSVSFGGVSVDLGASDATPAFDLSDATAYTGDSSLVTVGTISSGTWQGTAIATGYIAGTLTSKTLCDPVLVGTISGNAFLDEDDMASDSASKVASQQSIKAYVDSVASGLDMKCSSHVATTANLTADYNNGTSGVGATLTATSAGALSIDGETLASSERVLVKNQTAACHNGIYSVTNTGGHAACWILTRTTDFDSSTEVTSGAFTFVETGSTNGDHGFVMTSDGSITIGTTAINWTQFSGAGQITAGAGMTKSGNTLNVIAGDNITVNADDVALSTTITGVTSISSTCFTGTLQTAAQTNITSVGTLTSLCSSGDVTIGGDLTIAGDDLTMGTNTSGYLLIADGTNYNPVAMSGDVAITSSGATTIQASSVENSMLAGSIANSKLSNSTVSYGGVSLSLGGSDSTPAFDLADATNYPTSSLVGTITNAQLAGSIANSKLVNSTITLADGSSNSTDISLGGTMCFKGTSNEVEVAESSGIITIGLPSTVSGLTTVSATTLTGTLSTAVQSNITSLGSLSSLCVTGPVCMGSTLNTGSTITATTLCSSGDLVVAGDDITMGTNTSGYILVADGTNYNPVAVSGDVTISDAGAVTIAADAVENSMLANCTITVSDGSNTTAIALGGTATFSGTTNEVEVSESSGTLTIGLPSTVSGLTTVSATNLTGTLSTAAQGNITSVGTLSSLTISGALTVDTTTLKVDNHNNRVGIGTATPSHLLDIEGVGHAATCFVSADLCATTKVVGAALCVGGAYALPASDGSAGQILCTDGSGAIAFAAAASSGHTIAEDGSTFTSRTCLNFCGTAVSVTDCSATNSTDVQIRATGACMPIRLSAGTQCYTCLTSSVIGDCLQEDTSPTLGGNLDVNGNSIVSASNGNIPITPNGSGKVIVDGICHPTADGSAGQVLCTDGSAALQWATLSAGVTLNGSTDNTIATVTGSNALQGESNLTFDGSTLAVTGALTVGVDDTGHDVQFFGASAGHYMLWDQSADEMILRIGTTSTYAANTETGNLKLVNAGSDTDKQSVGIAFDVGAGNVGAIGKARIDAVHNGTGANSDLVFATQVSGTVTERIRILSGGGITFNGDTAAANALDDYEEGTWTACICAGSGSISLCTAYNTGSYTKIGRLVTLTGAFTVSSVSSPGGAALIYGMPFSTGGGSDQYEYRSAGSISPWAQTGTINSWAIFVPANSNTIYIQDNGVNAEADHFQAGTEIRMSMSYIV